MNDLNSLHIEGMVSKSPMYRTTKKGDTVCTFSIASNRYFKSVAGKKEKETSFFDVEAWKDEADKCQMLAHTGRRCRITGRIREDRWKSTKGEPRSKVVIVADFVEFRPETNKEEGKGYEQN
jgi:single-strand DNA-binding protein